MLNTLILKAKIDIIIHTYIVTKKGSVTYMGFDINLKGRAWFVTVQIKNMQNIKLTEEQYMNPPLLATILSNKWEESGKERTSAVSVCISKEGLYHAHMAVYGNNTTLKNVSKVLFNSHVEPILGGKKEMKEYLSKDGKYSDKGEKVLFVLGLDNVEDTQGHRKDLDIIAEELENGRTPREILSMSFKFYRYEKMIRSAYLDMHIADAPVMKDDLKCYWLYGASGSGKTYTYKQICDEKGVDNIFILNDFANKGIGGIDTYLDDGIPPILFMDEYKGEIPYGVLLGMLSPYSRLQTHARYKNVYNLWNEVYITSIYPPDECYKLMVDDDVQKTDSLFQLLRRITEVVYKYKIKDEYREFRMKGSDFKCHTDLLMQVCKADKDFEIKHFLSNNLSSNQVSDKEFYNLMPMLKHEEDNDEDNDDELTADERLGLKE